MVANAITLRSGECVDRWRVPSVHAQSPIYAARRSKSVTAHHQRGSVHVLHAVDTLGSLFDLINCILAWHRAGQCNDAIRRADVDIVAGTAAGDLRFHRRSDLTVRGHGRAARSRLNARCNVSRTCRRVLRIGSSAGGGFAGRSAFRSRCYTYAGLAIAGARFGEMAVGSGTGWSGGNLRLYRSRSGSIGRGRARCLISRSQSGSGLIRRSRLRLRRPQWNRRRCSLSNHFVVLHALYECEGANADHHGHASGNYDSAVGS